MGNKYKITQNYKIPAGVAGNYRKGYKRPEGVVIHASANPNASIDSEILYMAKNYKNAFTHAWAGHDKIIEIANTNYACWGAGGVANKRFVQIEMTEDKRLTKQQKIQVVDHAAYWAAVQLVYYKLPCKDASKGSGTVWGHTHVTKYLGGTTHTDPVAFLKTLGLTWNDVYKQVERYYNAYKKGTSDQVKSLDGTQGTVRPSTPTPSKPNKPANKTIEQLADEVIAGKHGTGEARKKALGSNYQAVQNLVNKKLGAKPIKPTKSIDQLAREVIDGKHGTGEARKKALGSRYNEVQKRVNQILRQKAAPTRKTTDQLAREVIDGKHGSGATRKRSLGNRYSEVQRRVNQLLGSGSSSNRKSVKQLADEVERGLHGDGAARKRSLGSRYNEVQAEINRRYR